MTAHGDENTGLQIEATIVKEDGEYHVWFTPHESYPNIINGFIGGIFPTFDAATAALLNVRGIVITKMGVDV